MAPCLDPVVRLVLGQDLRNHALADLKPEVSSQITMRQDLPSPYFYGFHICVLCQATISSHVAAFSATDDFVLEI